MRLYSNYISFHIFKNRPSSSKSSNPTSKSARKNLLQDIGSTPQLKKVIAPEQKLILPEAIGSEEGNRFARKASESSSE